MVVKQIISNWHHGPIFVGARVRAHSDRVSGRAQAKAAEIDINFGALTPTGGFGACTHASGDAGLVCPYGPNFTGNGSTFTAPALPR